jgi:hypothetical protein
MERHNQFDNAIKAKLGALEDEPSGKVWAGVRGEIGTVRPPQATAWPMRIAAAVALLCVTGLGWYLLRPDAGKLPQGLALREQSRVQRIVILPLDREGKSGTYLAEDDHAAQQLPQPGRQDQQIAIAPQRPIAPKDSLKPFEQLSPLQEDHRIEIVQENVPRQLESPAPKAPDLQVPMTPDPGAEVRTETAIASASTKRTIKMPERDDLTSDNLKRKSGAILGAITNGANSFLGLNANYDERNQDDLKLTAFNADFGLFKIKKVRTVKH